MKDYFLKTDPNLERMIAHYKKPEPRKETNLVDADGKEFPKSPSEELISRGAPVFSDREWNQRDWRMDYVSSNDKHFLWYFIGGILLLMLITGEFNA